MNTKIWHKMNAIVVLVIYTTLIVTMLSFFQYLVWLVLILLFVVPHYVASYYRHLRIVEKGVDK